MPEFTDANKNGYPDEFDKEERELLKQMSDRRKQYMAKMGAAEQSFGVGSNKPFYESEVPFVPVTPKPGYTDKDMVNDLFK